MYIPSQGRRCAHLALVLLLLVLIVILSVLIVVLVVVLILVFVLTVVLLVLVLVLVVVLHNEHSFLSHELRVFLGSRAGKIWSGTAKIDAIGVFH